MPRTRVKFCGIMSPGDARAAAAAGADAIGMILHANARRLIDRQTAQAIIAALPPYVSAIGLFVDAPAALITEYAAAVGLSAVQMHGNETPADVAAVRPVKIVKAVRVDAHLDDTLATWKAAVAGGEVPNLIGILLDGPGGGGKGVANDFARIKRLQDAGAFEGLPPVIIAGGLTPENVGQVVADLQPYAIDTSSGIESEYGKKSIEKMQDFMDAARR